VQAAIVRLGAHVPCAQAVEAVAYFLAVPLSAETARRLTEGVGAALVALETAEAEAVLQAPTLPPGPPLQQGSVDGAMVPLVGGEWAEVKTLVIGTVERTAGGALHTTAHSYFSRLCDAEQFRRLARGEAHRRGVGQAQTVCAVVDGAEWCRSSWTGTVPRRSASSTFPMRRAM
jgi:hypothetical protein